MSPRLTTGLLTLAAAAVGTLGTKPDSAWYRALRKPSWQPPAVAFPLVWTPLYAAIAWSTGRAAAAEEERRGRYLALTGANLAVNAGWCWAFFTARSPRGGLATIAVLDALNLALLRETVRRDPAAAAALAPYVAWTGFATALNAAHVRLN
ncbi:tryptophan-rich sensory protein [Nocardioides anomalus]|uniref:Tryptophan-rich sensory protein n=1 Tax=Nocardioides anomalus TaxID=2712223 RepID=A0A6G6WEV1_9ACTN|nr:TspO/MBR family protein [Nocardioides anomalus]QIG43683.1 tryptophan-rich sensory protein [Nocardioides anomalus]